MSMFSFGKAKSGMGASHKLSKFLVSDKFDDMAIAMISGNYVLSPEDYVSYWTNITKDRGACARVIGRIVSYLMDVERDPAKAEKAIPPNVNMQYFVTLLINTLYLLNYYCGFEPTEKAFVKSMGLYDDHKKVAVVFKERRIEESLIMLDARRKSNRGQTIRKMIVDCSTLETIEEMSHQLLLTSSSGPYLDRGDAETVIDETFADFPFVFNCLMRMSSAGQQIFELMLEQLRAAGKQLAAMVNNQSRTLALLLMMQEFLTVCPTSDDVWLQTAANVLTGLFKWPRPFGAAAQELHNFITLERRSPGYHWRQRLLAEHPSLHSLAATLDDSSSHVHVLLDPSIPICKTNKHILGYVSPTESEDMARQLQWKRDVLTYIFDIDFHIRTSESASSNSPPTTPSKPDPDPLRLTEKHGGDIISWYARALDIVEKAKLLPEDSLPKVPPVPGGLAKIYRESMLGTMLQEICPDITIVPRRSRSSSVPQINSRFGSFHIASQDEAEDSPAENNKTDNHTSVPPGKPHDPLKFGEFCPKLSPVVFECHDVTAMPSVKGVEYEKMRSGQGYLMRALDVEELRKIVTAAGVATPAIRANYQKQIQLERSLSNGSNAPDSPTTPTISVKVPVKIVLYGGPSVYHRFLCAYIALRASRPELFRSINVGAGKNDIATILARADRWYRRHIYYPFKKALPICPQYPSKEECSVAELEESGLASSLPASCLRSLLQDYVRQATVPVKVCVYECLCWTETGEASSVRRGSEAADSLITRLEPDIVIPFSIRVDIGILAQAEQYREPDSPYSTKQIIKPKKPVVEATSKDILADKDFIPSPIELTISSAAAALTGAVDRNTMTTEADSTDEMNMKVESFVALSFENISVNPYDELPSTVRERSADCMTNSATTNYIVMQSQLNKGLLADAVATRRRQQRVAETFFDALKDPESFSTPKHLSMVEVDVVNQKENFHVLIDGVVYGPFQRLVIRPCEGVDDEGVGSVALKVPIMTYMPNTI